MNVSPKPQKAQKKNIKKISVHSEQSVREKKKKYLTESTEYTERKRKKVSVHSESSVRERNKKNPYSQKITVFL
jgi:hypothetical protein